MYFFKSCKVDQKNNYWSGGNRSQNHCCRSTIFLGLLAHVSYPLPSTAPENLKYNSPRTEHFVFAQDTGGAIKGPGRADLFGAEENEQRCKQER